MKTKCFIRNAGFLACFALSVSSVSHLEAAESAQSPGDHRIMPAATGRTQIDFDRDWRFSKGDFQTAMMPAFNDSAWRHVNVPHDWSIEGPLGPEYASGTGYAPGGIGWYRKHFRLAPATKGKLAAIEFDGVYDHAEVWFNGQLVGGRPYGYSSFECDLTPYLRFGNQDNVIAVRVDHSRFADSRWYTGSGIYRHVRLRFTDPLRISPHGVYVTTPRVETASAEIRIETTVANNSGETRAFILQSDILGPDGAVAASLTSDGRAEPGTNQVLVQQLSVAGPKLWSVDTPQLYSVRTSLKADGTLADEVSTTFGIRTLRFDPNHGFFLNGTSMKLKGVCIHHDAGCLGAAVPDQVLERRLRLLKSLGVNAIRTSHNPPAPELLDFCDRLGFLVMDEAFDEFTPGKNKWVTGWNNGQPSHFGYSEDFAEWSVRDIRDMVRRDRNHPSIIMWSIGNEIDYANDPFSNPVLGNNYHPANPPAADMIKWGRPLIAAVKQLDRTRPVTAALANVAMSDAAGFAQLLDVTGYNYQESRYAADHTEFPERVLYGSENHQDYGAWTAVRDNPYVMGQFLWTGVDYLGEAGRWPNHASGSGLLDLCGFKKPLAWFRQSLWSDQPMVYICASRGRGRGRFGRMRGEETWNWPSNSTVMVRCYTTCPEVRLMLNGKSLGTKSKTDAVQGVLTWEVPFEPGTLTAVGLGPTVSNCEYSLKTAGPAARIELLPDVTQLTANGTSICHLEFRIVDSHGVMVPNANNEVTFNLAGPAAILGIGNGNLNDVEGYQGKAHKAYRGRGLVILESERAAGRITVTATSPGLESASVELNSR